MMKYSNLSPWKSLFPVLAVIAIGSFLLDYFLPAMGDDLGKWTYLGLDEYTCPNRQTISFLAGHYFGCNGRILDCMGPVVINLLPALIASAIMGFMAALYFVMMIVCSGFWQRGRITAAHVLVLVTIAVMPWYGAMYLRVCQFNYMWGTTFCLISIYYFFKESSADSSRWHRFLLLAAGVIAGFSHEQNGVAMTAVMLPYGWLMYRAGRLSVERKALLIGLLIGTFITIASPAIWNRAENSQPDSPMGKLIITTLPVYLLLLLVIVVMTLCKRGRAVLRQLVMTPWTAYVAVGFVSSMIAVYSTIPGRTGWLPESVAIVALAMMLSRLNWKVSRSTGTVVCIACLGVITWHFTASAVWQAKLGKEYNQVVDAFKQSATGTVFVDTTPYNAAPAITLWRAKGAPDADDIHLHNRIENAYGQDKHLTIIPEAFENQLPMMVDSVVDGRYTLYRCKPAVSGYHDSSNYPIEKTDDGRILTIFKFNDDTYYMASPHIIDPGDTWHPNVEMQ